MAQQLADRIGLQVNAISSGSGVNSRNRQALSNNQRTLNQMAFHKYLEDSQTKSSSDREENTGSGNLISGTNPESQSANQKEALSRRELLSMISERKKELYYNIINGETAPKIQIGANEFTQEEWEKTLADYDEQEEELKEAVREEIERKEQEAEQEMILKQEEA